MTQPYGFYAIVVAMGIFFWITAGRIYESHVNTKKNFPLMFKLTGLNVRYIDDRQRWIKCFRRQVILVVMLFIAVMMMNSLV